MYICSGLLHTLCGCSCNRFGPSWSPCRINIQTIVQFACGQ